MRASAVVVAAGRGLRLKSKIPKPLVKIDSKPLIIYCLLTLQHHPLVSEIILVVNSGNKKAIAGKLKLYRIGKVRSIVKGGRRRQDSVYCGLKASSPAADLILIHDAARPFIRREEVSAVIKEAAKTGAAILGVPVKCTIKQVQGSGFRVQGKYIVKRTLDRRNLWEIQTPQVFARELIVNAYRKFGRSNVTDDAALVEKLGAKVAIVPGSYRNIKITTPEDLILAESLLQHR